MTLQRHLAPAFVKTTSLELPVATQIKLSALVNLTMLTEVRQKVCKVEFVLEAGKWFEPKIGLSYFTAQLLEKGTATKSSSDIAEIFDYYGAHIEVNAGYDFVSVSLFALREHLLLLLPILQEIFLTPAFAENEWRLMKTIFLQNLKINNEKTSLVSSKSLRKNIFGAHHPYGSSIEETEVEAIQLSDFNEYYKSNFKIKHIFICGDLEDAEINFITTEFNFLFADTKKEVGPITQQLPAFAQHISKESVQSSLRIGKKSIQKNNADYGALILANHILGGFFGSRLMKNIREEKGLTYGIHSSIYSFQKDSIFSIEADVNKTNLALALSEIKSELNKLQTDIVLTEELVLAKNHFIGGLQTQMANPFSVIEKIKNIEINQLPANYYNQLINQIDKLTAEELQSICKKYFQEETFYEVTVG